MVSVRYYVVAVLVLLAALLSPAAARPRFSGLVSVDYASLEQGFSSKGAKGCQVISNALGSSESSDEDGALQLLRCDWE